tara:strand:- start:641 stop:2266 length:1626 start_codon:yes stop_codon:yes gene_type:complete
MAVIYRTYRPQNFNEMVGQEHIKTTLQNALMGGRLAHAYLLTGPRGLGKTTTARILAKAVNCTKLNKGKIGPKPEPCNDCAACTEVTAGRALDVIEIDAASHTGVDNVRENIIEHARFNPSQLSRKVFIIDEAHMLSNAAFNALLKTLEEPPAHVMFILVTTETGKIPATIVSRCQHFQFKRVGREDLIGRLDMIVKAEKKKVDKEIIEAIVARSEGCVRDAESLLGQVLSLADKKGQVTAEQAALVVTTADVSLALNLITHLSVGDSEKSLGVISELVESGTDLSAFTADLVEVLRRLLLATLNKQAEKDLAEVWAADAVKKATSVLKKVTTEDLIKMLNIWLDRQSQLRTADIVQLPLEMAVVEICLEKSGQSAAPAVASEKEILKEEEKKDDDEVPPAMTQANNEPALQKSKPKDKAKKIAKAASKQGGEFSLDQIKSKWGEVLDVIKHQNYSLASTLKSHLPAAIEGEVVHLRFRYRFHKDRISDQYNRILLEDALKNVFKSPLRIEAAIEEVSASPKKSDEQLKTVLNVFGGDVVD